MRHFRMPTHNSENLSRFKKQVGTILRELKEFDEKEKNDALIYLQDCIKTDDKSSASTNLTVEPSNCKGLKNSKRTRKICGSTSTRKIRNKTISNQKKQTLKLAKSIVSSVVKSRVYKCKDCGFTHKLKKKLMIHLEIHDGFPLSCLKCKSTFNNELVFEWHSKFYCNSKMKNTERLFQCNECSGKFLTKQNLLTHIQGHKRNNCTYCDKVITKRKELIEHLFDAHGIKLEQALHKCNHCDKRYVKRVSLYYHLRQHFVNQFVCLDCGKVNNNKDEFDEHIKTHEHLKRFKCLRCNEKFSRRQQYLSHIKRHENYKCITCNESYASRLKLMVHKHQGHITESVRPKFVCPECRKGFTQKSKFMAHLRKHADHKPSLLCQYCEKSFQSPYAYYKHCITVSHEKVSPQTSIFICESCGTQFPKKYLLEQHRIRVHNNPKTTISCQYCDYKTKNKANMDRHVDLHLNNEKKFICEQCGKNFANIASLKDHISYSHIQDKQFKCTECDKVFKRNSELIRHRKTHSNARPHICISCGQSYKRINHLRRHEKVSHNIISKSRNPQKYKVEADGSVVPILKEKSPAVPPLVTILEPLVLVTVPDTSRVITISGMPVQDSTYFFENVGNDDEDFDLGEDLPEDYVLDMSNQSVNSILMNPNYNSEELIQQFMGENFNFIDGNVNSTVILPTIVPSNRRHNNLIDHCNDGIMH